MVINRFFINIIIRVIFIIISCVFLGIVLQYLDRGYYYTLAGSVFLILLQAWLLVNQVNKTNKDLEKFLSSVQDHDSSIRFSEDTGNTSFKKLRDSMNYLNTAIQSAKIESERARQFLQSVVEHVDVGLISFDLNGRIEIYNRAAERYLAVRQPKRLSSLQGMNDEMVDTMCTIKPGQKILHKMKINHHMQRVLIKATELRFDTQVFKLVSFEDITNELDRNELDSWQRLIRVLTHEIMNSISPITSLTAVISGYFKNKENEDPVVPEEINHQIIGKTLAGLNTIEETGKGLLDFVDKYRSMTSLPEPNLTKFTVDSLFQQCKLLMESNIPENIKIVAAVQPSELAITGDFAQLEQVLINLIKNAIEATSGKKNGIIRLKASVDEGDVLIQVEDNGIGISDDIIEDIFVPFYTTKKNGSGIGLSLSKRVIQNHHGNISVSSAPGKGAVFTLKFQG